MHRIPGEPGGPAGYQQLLFCYQSSMWSTPAQYLGPGNALSASTSPVYVSRHDFVVAVIASLESLGAGRPPTPLALWGSSRWIPKKQLLGRIKLCSPCEDDGCAQTRNELSTRRWKCRDYVRSRRPGTNRPAGPHWIGSSMDSGSGKEKAASEALL